MTERAVARITLPFDFRTDWQRKQRFRERMVALVSERLRGLRGLDFERTSVELPLLGDVDVVFDQVPPACRQLGSVPSEVELQIVLAYPEPRSQDKDEGSKSFWEVQTLPLPGWDQYWDRIYVDGSIKQRALNYSLLVYRLGKSGISNMCLAQHRIALLWGPPGTGKTTLSRGLANRAARVFAGEGEAKTTFIEIDAHKLSSKWLGESQKLIEDAFNGLLAVADGFSPVVCLFDEVESLLTNRALSLNEGNPVDVYRAVNAVLQFVDRLSERPNVFIIATSNLSTAIDPAFSDRIDMSFYVDLPPLEMRAAIFSDIVRELKAAVGGVHSRICEPDGSAEWNEILAATHGYSGRQLRKLVIEALSDEAELARDPSRLALRHIAAAIANRERVSAREQSERDRYARSGLASWPA